ncbi:MAG: tyrosine-type recombinase/integrase [Romboutsia sp.]
MYNIPLLVYPRNKKILPELINSSNIKYFENIFTQIYRQTHKIHGLRHTFATRLFELDIHPKAVQELMDHSNINVIMDIYTHVTKNVSHAAIDNIQQKSREIILSTFF